MSPNYVIIFNYGCVFVGCAQLGMRGSFAVCLLCSAWVRRKPLLLASCPAGDERNMSVTTQLERSCRVWRSSW